MKEEKEILLARKKFLERFQLYEEIGKKYVAPEKIKSWKLFVERQYRLLGINNRNYFIYEDEVYLIIEDVIKVLKSLSENDDLREVYYKNWMDTDFYYPHVLHYVLQFTSKREEFKRVFQEEWAKEIAESNERRKSL